MNELGREETGEGRIAGSFFYRPICCVMIVPMYTAGMAVASGYVTDPWLLL